MYQLNLASMSKQEFLDEYWQKKPVVIRQGFKNFQDPIAADEVAGLAMEEQVESRLVYKKAGEWQAEFGPFESYDHLGGKDWSLVVQALDNFSEEAAAMIEPFRFIPHWRLDDLMVSFATPGGGVGPHIDLYDVFICQGSGKRHWRVGDIGNHREFAAHEALLHVDPFDAIIDVELMPGDILYIPPGFPHEGITLETSLSFSVGFRTHSNVSLLSAFADHLIDYSDGSSSEHKLGNELLKDPQRKVVSHSGEVTKQDYLSIKNQLQKLLDSDCLFENFTGCFLTQAKHELDILLPDEPFSSTEVQSLLGSHAMARLGGLRAFYLENNIEHGLCYINGDAVDFDISIIEAVKLMCDNVQLQPSDLAAWQNNEVFIDFVMAQLNKGYWYLAEAK